MYVWVESGLFAYLVMCTTGCLVLGSGSETILVALCKHMFFLLVCGFGTSPRPISTGRLGIAAVYLRPINPIVCGGPYQVCPVGNFILKCASRLDAFSGYHVRT